MANGEDIDKALGQLDEMRARRRKATIAAYKKAGFSREESFQLLLQDISANRGVASHAADSAKQASSK